MSHNLINYAHKGQKGNQFMNHGSEELGDLIEIWGVSENSS
jgi:hypothetical protein